MSSNFDVLKAGYQEKWDDMKIIRTTAVANAANEIMKGMPRYKAISKMMGNGMPPEVIGVIHLRESDLDFGAHLHNGDKPLSRPTRHVPRGRGPFESFEESAVDALSMEGAKGITDWSIPRQSWFLEKFNGFGYQHKAGGNPYLYGGTNEYTSGKFVSDGVYDPSFHDPQLGVMAILKQLYRVQNYRETRDVVVENSTKLTLLKRVRLFGVWLGGVLYTSTFFDFAKDALSFIKENQLWFLAGAAVLGWLLFKWVEFKSVDDHLKGNYIPSGLDTANSEQVRHEPPIKAEEKHSSVGEPLSSSEKADVVHTESTGPASDNSAGPTDNSGTTGNA